MELSSGARMALPVDILEDDDIFTRGYVQDVLSDGHCVIYFDRENDPVQKISANQVHQTLESTSSNDNYRRARAGPDRYPNILIRDRPGDSWRWYSSEEQTHVSDTVVVEVKTKHGGKICVFKEDSEQLVYKRNRNNRKEMKYANIELRITASLKCHLEGGIDSSWEKRTKTLIKSTDFDRFLVTFIVAGDHPLITSPDTFLNSWMSELHDHPDQSLEDSGDGHENKAVEEESDRCRLSTFDRRDDVPTGNKRKMELLPTEKRPKVSSALFGIPELMVAVFRYLDLRDRHTLRGVCSIWKDVACMTLVCRSAHYDDSVIPTSDPAFEDTASDFPSSFDRIRYFTRLHYDNLTTISVRCSANLEVVLDEYNHDELFVELLARVHLVVAPSLGTLILYGDKAGHLTNGRIGAHHLEALLAWEQPPRILLRNVVVHYNRAEYPVDIHVFVKEANLHRSRTPSEEGSSGNDDHDGARSQRQDHLKELASAEVLNLLLVTPDRCPLGSTCLDEILKQVAQLKNTSPTRYGVEEAPKRCKGPEDAKMAELRRAVDILCDTHHKESR